MKNVTYQKNAEEDDNFNEHPDGKPNTENGDLAYTEDEVEYADGHGTLLDEEIDDQNGDVPED